MTSDHTSRIIQIFLHTDMNRIVNKRYCFQQILCLGSSGTLHEEGPISQPLGALEGSVCCLEALLHREGRQLARGFSSLADDGTTNRGRVTFVKKGSLSESESESSSGLVRSTCL